MRDELPKKVKIKECEILNLDDAGDNPPGNNGTHWVCWFFSPRGCYYFDSFGLSPPLEIKKRIPSITYNIYQIQPLGTNICGHLCLYILNKLDKGEELKKVLENLLNNT